MRTELQTFLADLKAHGVKNKIPNVSETVGRFLNMMVRVRQPERILEIGCANGYSTLWMAEAARQMGAKINSVDFSRPTFEAAQRNIAEAGFDDVVNFHFGDALELLAGARQGGAGDALREDGELGDVQRGGPDLCGPFDFVFVDGEKASYLEFWTAIQPILAERAIIIFDDMMAFPEKTATFAAELARMERELVAGGEPAFHHMLLPIDDGDGIVMLTKNH